MEKPSKLRKGILKFLPGSAAASIPFRSPPTSPRTANPGKGHQGLTPSIIPKGAPRRLKSGSFDAREPSSPMVSCVGQIKSNKEEKKKKNKIRDLTILKQVLAPQREVMVEQDLHHADDVENKSQSQSQKQKSLITGFLKGIKHGKKNAIKEIFVPPNNDFTLPYLGSVTKFTSGRGALADFDWRAFGVAVVRDCSVPCLDEEEERTKDYLCNLPNRTTQFVKGNQSKGRANKTAGAETNIMGIVEEAHNVKVIGNGEETIILAHGFGTDQLIDTLKFSAEKRQGSFTFKRMRNKDALLK